MRTFARPQQGLDVERLLNNLPPSAERRATPATLCCIQPRGPTEEDAVAAALEALQAAGGPRRPSVCLPSASPQLDDVLVGKPPEAAACAGQPAGDSALDRLDAQLSSPHAQGQSPTRPAAPRKAMPPISSAGCREIDPALARVIDAWPKLPRSIQAAIRTLVETAREG